MRDASLDEFATDDESEASRTDDESEASRTDEGDEDGERAGEGVGDRDAPDVDDGDEDAPDVEDRNGKGDAPDVEDVTPAVATFDFAPDGAACEACEATVRRRWRDGDALVCEGCKEWSVTRT